MKACRFEVFGRMVEITRRAQRWEAFYLGPDGKKRPAKDIVIPADVPEGGLARYLGDLLHERATERYPEVRRVD